jgi:polysaccharide export outer membrane protein
MARAATLSAGSRTGAAIAGILLASMLAACGATRKARMAEGDPVDPCANTTYQQQIESLVAARQQPPGTDASYTVSPGDLLVVTVYNYRPEGGDFSSDVRVDDRGYISLPMMDPIQVAGLSVAQVHRAIVGGLRRAEVLKEPLVSVFVKDYQGQEVVVLGAVARPGMYHLSRGKQTLVDVISMAGGLAQNAGNFVLVRPAGTGKSEPVAQAYAIHTDAATEPMVGADGANIPICLDTAAGQPDPAILMLQVRGGDLVIVPEAGKAFIDGEVDKPGPYPLNRGMTLMQLISSAGGLTFPADPTRVRLVRKTVTGDSVEWQVNLEHTASDLQPDVRLARDDRVIIPYTTGRKAVYGVYQFVTAIVRITVGGAANIF